MPEKVCLLQNLCVPTPDRAELEPNSGASGVPWTSVLWCKAASERPAPQALASRLALEDESMGVQRIVDRVPSSADSPPLWQRCWILSTHQRLHRKQAKDLKVKGHGVREREKAALMAAFNGDVRNMQVQHFCAGPSCCADRSASVTKCLDAITAPLQRRVPIPAANRWVHVFSSVCYIAVLVFIHRLLPRAEAIMTRFDSEPTLEDGEEAAAENTKDGVGERYHPDLESSNVDYLT